MINHYGSLLELEIALFGKENLKSEERFLNVINEPIFII